MTEKKEKQQKSDGKIAPHFWADWNQKLHIKDQLSVAVTKTDSLLIDIRSVIDYLIEKCEFVIATTRKQPHAHSNVHSLTNMTETCVRVCVCVCGHVTMSICSEVVHLFVRSPPPLTHTGELSTSQALKCRRPRWKPKIDRTSFSKPDPVTSYCLFCHTVSTMISCKSNILIINYHMKKKKKEFWI